MQKILAILVTTKVVPRSVFENDNGSDETVAESPSDERKVRTVTDVSLTPRSLQ